MKITQEQAESLFDNEDIDDLEFVEELDWIDDGKYQYCNVVFKKGGKHYWMGISRSGGYFSHYEYQYDLYCNEVNKVATTTEVWKEV